MKHIINYKVYKELEKYIQKWFSKKEIIIKCPRCNKKSAFYYPESRINSQDYRKRRN